MDFYYLSAVQRNHLPKGMLNFDAFFDLTLEVAVRYFGGTAEDSSAPLVCLQELLAPVKLHLDTRPARAEDTVV